MQRQSTSVKRLASRCLLAAALVFAAAGVSATPDAASDTASNPAVPAADETLMRRMRDTASDMVLTAMNFLGVPYRRGGNSAEEGFDCSGFTRHIFETSLGLLLPRRADEQAKAPGLTKIAREELKPGDLVFFNTLKRSFSHVGIYVGDGKFIHAPRTGAHVRVEDMRFAYWSKRFTGARRADTPPSAGVVPAAVAAAAAAAAVAPPAPADAGMHVAH